MTAVGNDDEDENVDVEGDTETTMYDIVYGGGGGNGVWSGQQQHNRMRQHSMVLHGGGGFGRGGEYNVRFITSEETVFFF